MSLFGAISSFRRCLASNRPNLVLLMAQHNCLGPRRRRFQEEVDSSTDGGPFSCSLKMSTEISVFIYRSIRPRHKRDVGLVYHFQNNDPLHHLDGAFFQLLRRGKSQERIQKVFAAYLFLFSLDISHTAIMDYLTSPQRDSLLLVVGLGSIGLGVGKRDKFFCFVWFCFGVPIPNGAAGGIIICVLPL